MQCVSLPHSRGNRLQPATQRPAVQARRFRVQALVVPPEYGFVMASVAFTAVVTQWQAIQVMKARKECGVPYPTMYATGDGELANKFNCTQRGHQNMLETLPLQLAMQLLVSLVYPRAAALQGLVWTTGRIFYNLGYQTGDPKKRFPGALVSSLSYWALMLATAVLGVRIALGM